MVGLEVDTTPNKKRAIIINNSFKLLYSPCHAQILPQQAAARYPANRGEHVMHIAATNRTTRM
jgi:P pilus assembly chaperone PapD